MLTQEQTDANEDNDEEYEEYIESTPLTHMRGKAFYRVITWFALLAVLMVPVNMFHWGFIGLLTGMAIATTILLMLTMIVRGIKHKMERFDLTCKQWALTLMGFHPHTLDIDTTAQVFDDQGNTYSAGTSQTAQTTALTRTSRDANKTDEQLPDQIIEENGLYLSEQYQPALAPMCGENVLIVGNRGMGKSNLLGVIGEEIGPHKTPTLFIDPLDQFSPLAERRWFPHGFTAGHPDLARIAGVPQHFIPVTMRNAFQVGQKIVGFNLQVIFNMRSYLTLDDATVVLCELIRGILGWEEAHANQNRLPCIILFDEASMLVPQEPKEGGLTRKPVQEISYKTFFNLVARGRNYGISLWVATQRIQLLHKNMCQCAYKYLFYQGQKTDLEQYAVFGLDAIDVMSLQVGECYIFTPVIIGFRCFIRERRSKHEGHTPGLDALKRYQAQHQMESVQAMTGEQVAGVYYDETTPGFQSLTEQHGNFGDAIHETAGFQQFPTNGSINYEIVRPVSYGSENRTGLDTQNRHETGLETEHLKTGFQVETRDRRPQQRPFEVDGKQLTEEQFAAYNLFVQENKQTLSALAVALTSQGKFGRVDNNRAQRLRQELEALGLIQVSTHTRG